MKEHKNNRVRMIGPKGKVSYVSLKASKSVHLANLGFMVADDQGPEFDEGRPFVPPPAGQDGRSGPVGFKLNMSADAGQA